MSGETNVRILGSGEKPNFKAYGAAWADQSPIWKINELENAFYFFVPNTKKEIYLEHDELSAEGEAYKERGPLNILDVVELLEEETPDFHSMVLSPAAFLIRKRLPRSTGVTLEIDGKIIIFIKDATLTTINFIDFYFDFLKPKLRGQNEADNAAESQDIAIRLAGAGNKGA
jgi:hypothetical protein